MPTVAEIGIIISGESRDFDREAAKAERRLGDLENRFNESLARIGGFMRNAGMAMTAGVTVPLGLLAKGSFDAAVKMESLRANLRTMMGSASATEKELKKLERAARLPGMDFAQAVRGSAALQMQTKKTSATVEEAADKARYMLEQFSNAVALSGGGRAEFERVVTNLIQISGAAKLTGDELKEMAAVVGPPFRQALEDAFGTSRSEDLAKMGITGEQAITGISLALAKMPRAQFDTMKNHLENMQQDWFMLKVAIGETLMPLAKELLPPVVEWLQRMREVVSQLTPEQKQMAINIGLTAMALGPALMVLGSFVSMVANLRMVLVPAIATIHEAGGALTVFRTLIGALTGPVGWLIAAAGLVYAAWQTNFANTREVLSDLWEDITQTFGQIVAEVRAFLKENQQDIKVAWDWVLAQARSSWSAVLAVLQTAWRIIKEVVRQGLDFIMTTLRIVSGIIHGDWQKVWNEMAGFVSRTWDRIMRAVLAGATGVLRIIDNMADKVGGFAEVITGQKMDFTGFDAAITTLEGIYGAYEASADAATSATEKFVASTAKVPGLVGNIGTANPFGTGTPPGRASGSGSGGAADKASKEKTAYDKANESLRDYIATQMRARALAGDDSPLAQLVYDINSGEFRDADLKLKLIALSQLGLAEGAKKTAASLQDFEDRMNAVNRETDLGRATTELARIEVERMYAGLKPLTEVQRESLRLAIAEKDAEQALRDAHAKLTEELKREEEQSKALHASMLNRIAALRVEADVLQASSSLEGEIIRMRASAEGQANPWLADQAETMMRANAGIAAAINLWKEYNAQIERRDQDAQKMLDSLRQENTLATMVSAVERELYKFRNSELAKANPLLVEQIENEIRLRAERERSAAFKDHMSEINQRMLELSVGTSEARIQMLMLNEAMTRLEAETVVAAQARLDKMVEEMELFEKLADGIADTLVDSFSEGWEGIKAGFRKMLQDLAAEYLKSYLRTLLVKFFVGLGGGAASGAFGSETVPGLGGAGHQGGGGEVFASAERIGGPLSATRSIERSISRALSTRLQTSGSTSSLVHGNASTTIGGDRVNTASSTRSAVTQGGDTIVMHIHGVKDAQSFMQSEQQVLSRLGAGIDKVKRRNGGRS